MANFALINNVDHQDIKVMTGQSVRFGDNVRQSVVFPFEFRNLQGDYPILLHRGAEDNLYPVALHGFEDGENLFLNESGWHASYVPAMVRRQPFMIGYQKNKANAEDMTRVLTIDLDNPRVNTEEGEALFRPLGGRTPYLDDAADLLEQIYEGVEHSKGFVAALQRLELVESIVIEVTLENGAQHQLLGYFGLDEKKVSELGGDALAELSGHGYLLPLFMMLASMNNIRKLVDFRNQKLQAG